MPEKVTEEQFDSFVHSVQMIARLGEAVAKFDGSALAKLQERGLFKTELKHKGKVVELLPHSEAWLRRSAMKLERAGFDLLAHVFNDILVCMGIQGERPKGLSDPKLKMDSPEMEIATSLADLVEIVEVLRPLHEAAVAVHEATRQT